MSNVLIVSKLNEQTFQVLQLYFVACFLGLNCWNYSYKITFSFQCEFMLSASRKYYCMNADHIRKLTH